MVDRYGRSGLLYSLAMTFFARKSIWTPSAHHPALKPSGKTLLETSGRTASRSCTRVRPGGCDGKTDRIASRTALYLAASTLTSRPRPHSAAMRKYRTFAELPGCR